MLEVAPWNDDMCNNKQKVDRAALLGFVTTSRRQVQLHGVHEYALDAVVVANPLEQAVPTFSNRESGEQCNTTTRQGPRTRDGIDLDDRLDDCSGDCTHCSSA